MHSALRTLTPPARRTQAAERPSSPSAWPINPSPSDTAFWAGYTAGVADGHVSPEERAEQLAPINPPPVVSGSTAPSAPVANDCPAWCVNAAEPVDRCVNDHMSVPIDTPATASGYANHDRGAMFPLVTAYAREEDDIRQVTLCIHNPLPGAGEREGWQDCDLTPAEARRIAVALINAAHLAETA